MMQNGGYTCGGSSPAGRVLWSFPAGQSRRTGRWSGRKRHVGCHERCRARGVPGRGACWRAERGHRHRGPDTGRPGLVQLRTGRAADGADGPPLTQATAIRAAGRFGLCIQDARPPYRYVSAEGPVLSEEDPGPGERLAMARRYLGAAGGHRYLAENPDPGRQNVAFRMRPEHWLSQDQGKRQADG